MIHIYLKCDFCGQPYTDDLEGTFDVACYPQKVLQSIKKIRERAIYHYWIYSSNNKRWYCPKCAKELELAEKANEWHFVKDGDYPKDNKPVLCILGEIDSDNYEVGYYNNVENGEPWHFETYHLPDDDGEDSWGVSAWQKITPPKLK